MSKIDPEAERKRLTEFYSQQMDGELEQVAAQAYELTEAAREALRAELAKRGLTPNFVDQVPVVVKDTQLWKPGDPPPSVPLADKANEDGELELRNMVTIRQFRDLPEALLAKGCLDSAGIECALVDTNMVRLDWFISNLLGGVKLQVAAEDATSANELLNQPIPEDFDVSGIGPYQQPRCPSCQSMDVTFKELNRPVSFMTAWLHVPVPVHRRAWRCHLLQCGVGR